MKRIIIILFLALVAAASASALSPQSLEFTTWQTDDENPTKIRLSFGACNDNSVSVSGSIFGNMSESLSGELWSRGGVCYLKLRNDSDMSSTGIELMFYGTLDDISSRKIAYDFELDLSFMGRGQEQKGRRVFRRAE